MQMNDNLTAHPASAYDDHVRQSIPNYDSFHGETINIVSVYAPNPGIWLDTGCGTGTLVERAYSQFPNTRFLLADPSQAMLEHASQKLRGRNRAVILPPAETRHLQLSEEVDVITAIQAHHYSGSEVRKACTQKCFDLLRPAGMFITFENIRPFTGIGVEIGKEYWRSFQEHAGKSREEAQRHLERFGKEFQPITVEEHVALLRGYNFKVVELLWYSYMQAGFYCIK